MLYKLRTKVNQPDAIIDLKSNADKVLNYFVSNIGAAKFLEFSKVSFIAQKGYNALQLESLDYLQASSNLLVVSEKAKNKIASKVGGEVEFHPCDVFCESEVFQFFIIKINLYKDLVNVVKSEFRTLSDGRQVLMNPIFNKISEPDFFISKDKQFNHIYAVSDKFFEIASEDRLHLEMIELPT